MRMTNCTQQDERGQTGRFRLGRAASLGLAGMIGALFSGCAYISEMSGGGTPTIKPIYITRSADTAASYYDLGKHYFWQNRFDKAREAFQQALKLQANNVDALNGLGAVYDQLGQFEAAQQSYRQALSLAPGATHIWANLGYSLLLQGRPDTAVAMLEKAISLDPADTMARQHLALATEASAKLAASVPENSLPPPIAGSTERPPQAPAAGAQAKPSMLVESVKPAAPLMVTLMPRERATHSNLMTVSPTRPDPAQAEQRVASSARAVETRTAPKMMTAPSPQPLANLANYAPHAASLAPVSLTAAAPSLGRARIEVSNGNGVNGMARALSAAMKTEGANVTRITNAIPFDKPRTVIICADDKIETAKAIAKLLPGNPAVNVGSTAHRNVEIRVVLGADAARTWSSSKKMVVATLNK